MAQFFQEIIQLYTLHILQTGKQPQFIILLSFLVTFLIVRTVTHMIHTRPAQAPHRTRLFRDITIKGTHIHHLVWGILLLLITGYSAIAFDSQEIRIGLGLLFGSGAALTLDEFALWLSLEDVYWTQEGRRSIDAVIAFAAILALILLGLPFWQAAGREGMKVLALL